MLRNGTSAASWQGTERKPCQRELRGRAYISVRHRSADIPEMTHLFTEIGFRDYRFLSVVPHTDR
jgi:hypothetical protein